MRADWGLVFCFGLLIMSSVRLGRLLPVWVWPEGWMWLYGLMLDFRSVSI